MLYYLSVHIQIRRNKRIAIGNVRISCWSSDAVLSVDSFRRWSLDSSVSVGTKVRAGKRRIFPWIRGRHAHSKRADGCGAQSPAKLSRLSFSKTNQPGTENTTKFNNAWRGISTPPHACMVWIGYSFCFNFVKNTDVYCGTNILRTLYWKEIGKVRFWTILRSSDWGQ
jgi:hypothetical protein